MEIADMGVTGVRVNERWGARDDIGREPISAFDW
jgi:hypothetical protein